MVTENMISLRLISLYFIIFSISGIFSNKTIDWRCSSVYEQLTSMWKALDSTSGLAKKKKSMNIYNTKLNVNR